MGTVTHTLTCLSLPFFKLIMVANQELCTRFPHILPTLVLIPFPLSDHVPVYDEGARRWAREDRLGQTGPSPG